MIKKFDEFLNEGLVTDLKRAYPKAYEFFVEEKGDAWVVDNCLGSTAEKMAAHVMVSHYVEEFSRDLKRISKLEGKEKFMEFKDGLEYYDNLTPAIFTKSEWDRLQTALDDEVNERLMS